MRFFQFVFWREKVLAARARNVATGKAFSLFLLSMPLKKNTKTRTSATTKSRRNSVLRDDKVGPRTAPLVTALKENNRCLATALDESRHEYRALQESFIKLQQERQKLLEKVASLENQLLKQDHHLFAIHVQPSLQLLNQAEKDIKHAKECLKRLFIPTTVAPTASSTPEFLSPIRECHAGRKCDDIPSSIKFGSEAEVRHASEKPKTVYPKTPHPAASLKSPQLSSTPLKENQSDIQSPILVCSPRAIDFEEFSLPDGKSSDAAARKRDPELHKAKKASHNGDSQTGAKQDNATPVVSPGLPENENQRTENEAFSELENIHLELNATELLQRPRRRCTSLNISYQEPSLNRKLRRGDPFTSENVGFLNSEKTKSKDHHGTQKPIRATLRDLTNKK